MKEVLDESAGHATWVYAAIIGAAALIIFGAVGVAIHIKRRKAGLAAKSVGDNALAPTS